MYIKFFKIDRRRLRKDKSNEQWNLFELDFAKEKIEDDLDAQKEAAMTLVDTFIVERIDHIDTIVDQEHIIDRLQYIIRLLGRMKARITNNDNFQDEATAKLNAENM